MANFEREDTCYPTRVPSVYIKPLTFGQSRIIERKLAARRKLPLLEDRGEDETDDVYNARVDAHLEEMHEFQEASIRELYDIMLFLFKGILCDSTGDPYNNIQTRDDVENSLGPDVANVILEDMTDSMMGKHFEKKEPQP